jgi:hypothetical protein
MKSKYSSMQPALAIPVVQILLAIFLGSEVVIPLICSRPMKICILESKGANSVFVERFYFLLVTIFPLFSMHFEICESYIYELWSLIVKRLRSLIVLNDTSFHYVHFPS